MMLNIFSIINPAYSAFPRRVPTCGPWKPACATDPRANLAIDMYCYILRKHIGALVAALDGLDLLVFTGGIGEHSACVRRQTCTRLSHLGITVDPALNDRSASVISALNSRVVVRVVSTDEARMIARHVVRLAFPN